MQRPRITLHIFTSLDGRITGEFGKTPLAKEASNIFKEIGFNDSDPKSLHFDGWIYGKNTSFEGFGNHRFNAPQESFPVPLGDYIVSTSAERYYIALDRHGEIGWQKQTASYGGQEATVIEVLTEQASASFRHFLRCKQIPYIIAGKKDIDFELMLDKLVKYYDLKNLLLGGGGIINWRFLEQELVDEISLVMAPTVDGAPGTARLFNACDQNDPRPINFYPKQIKTYSNGTLWLRYVPIRKNK